MKKLMTTVFGIFLMTAVESMPLQEMQTKNKIAETSIKLFWRLYAYAKRMITIPVSMADLAEAQRKYLQSADPEDREALYSYEKASGISWNKIYELRNKIRQEKGIDKDFELALLAKIKWKYLSAYLNNPNLDEFDRTRIKDQLHGIVSHMFDSLSPKEINILHNRVIRGIKEGREFNNITTQLIDDEEGNKEFKEFTQKFAPPLNIQETIESHKNVDFDLLKGKNESANVFAKGHNFSRLFNAERMRNYIESNGFTTVAVAKKWIYKVNGEWRVYAEYIPSANNLILTLETTKELVKLAEQTGYRDWSSVEIDKHGKITIIDPNIITDQRNGKITFIDTEDSSFKITKWMHQDKNFPQNCILQYAYSLYIFYDLMADDAQKWFDEHIDYLKNSTEYTTENQPLPLPLSRQFDDPRFNFESIREKLEEDTDGIRY